MKLSPKELHFINAMLLNDEKSTDQELITFLEEKFKCSRKIAQKIISKREAIKNDPLNIEITNKDLR